MVAALIVLVLLLLLFGGGGLLSSSLQILWIVLLIGLILWALGFVFRGSSGGRDGVGAQLCFLPARLKSGSAATWRVALSHKSALNR